MRTRLTNVDLVRRAYEDGPVRLPLSPDDERTFIERTFEEYYDEKLEIRMPPDYPEGEVVLTGRAGMARLFAMLRDTWTEFRFEPERFIDCGEQVAEPTTPPIRAAARSPAAARRPAGSCRSGSRPTTPDRRQRGPARPRRRARSPR